MYYSPYGFSRLNTANFDKRCLADANRDIGGTTYANFEWAVHNGFADDLDRVVVYKPHRFKAQHQSLAEMAVVDMIDDSFFIEGELRERHDNAYWASSLARICVRRVLSSDSLIRPRSTNEWANAMSWFSG